MKSFAIVLLFLGVLCAMPRAQTISDLAKKAEEAKAQKEKQKAADATKPNGDEAKQGDETKTDNAKTPAPKTFTDKDLKSDPHDQAPPPPPTSTDVAVGSVTAPKSSSEAVTRDSIGFDRRTEAYWKDRLMPIWMRLDADQAGAMAAQKRVDEYQTALDRSRHTEDGVTYVDRTIEQHLLEAQDEASRFGAAAFADRNAIAQIEEEARQADVPPGWLRRVIR